MSSEIDKPTVDMNYQSCLLHQKRNVGPMKASFPPVPNYCTPMTSAVLVTYKNMAETWARAGGTIPDPNTNEMLELLRVMGCNGIEFVAKKGK